MRTVNTAGKLPWSVKICYNTGSFAKSIQGLAISIYLLYFYTNGLGIDPKLAADIVFWGRIWDILNDPIVGALVDRTNSAQGRCRSYLRRFAIPGGILLGLCFIVPELNNTATMFWIVSAYLLQSWSSTLLQIPLNTLMGRISTQKAERAQLNQISLFISLGANYLVTSYTLPIAVWFGGENMKKGFALIGILFGVLYALSFLVVYWGTRGYEQQDTVQAPSSPVLPQKEPLHLGALLKNRMWLLVSLMYLLFTVSTTLESSAMLYYYQYVFHDTGLLQKYSATSTVCCLIVFLALPYFVRLLGNAGVPALGCVLYVSGHLLRYFTQDSSLGILFTGWALANLGLSLISSTVLLNIFDAKVYGEWKTGIRHDAILMSGFTVASKVGMAFGGAAVGWLLDTVPYPRFRLYGSPFSKNRQYPRWQPDRQRGVGMHLPWAGDSL